MMGSSLMETTGVLVSGDNDGMLYPGQFPRTDTEGTERIGPQVTNEPVLDLQANATEPEVGADGNENTLSATENSDAKKGWFSW